MTKIAVYGSDSGSIPTKMSWIRNTHNNNNNTYPDRAGEPLLLHNVDNVGDDSCSLQLLLAGQRLHPCLNTSNQSCGSGFIESGYASGSNLDPGF
jgi:hypothetical protein